MSYKIVKKWEEIGVFYDNGDCVFTESDKFTLANHLKEASTYFYSLSGGTGMFLAGEEVSKDHGTMLLIIATARLYRRIKKPFSIKHLYYDLVETLNSLSDSMVEISSMGYNIDIEMIFISSFTDIYDPKEREIDLSPKKFVDRFKLKYNG